MITIGASLNRPGNTLRAGIEFPILLDIGIERGSVSAVADRTWVRDYPH